MPNLHEPLTGVLLAAGMGTRLKDLTADKPKALVTVAGRPLFMYALDFLRAAGAQRLVVVVGSHAAEVRAQVLAYAPDVTIFENPRYEGTGNLLSLRAALPQLTNSFLMVNVDHIYAPPIAQVVARQRTHGVVAFVDHDRPLGDDDMKVWAEGNELLRISKKLTDWNAGYVGMTYVDSVMLPAYRAAVEAVVASRGDQAAVEEVLGQLAASGQGVTLGNISGVGWYEVDTPDERARAEAGVQADARFARTTPTVARRQKRKICVVLINRANYGRLKPLLTAIVQHPDLELQLVVGSSMLIYRFGRSVDVVEADGFTVSDRLYMHVDGETPVTMGKSIGMGLLELPSVFERLQPDVVLVNADRYETLAIAIAAASMNIPAAHTLGGEITGTFDEYVRHAVTKLSSIHFAAHPNAADRIVQMGEDPETVYLVGNPSLDVARHLDLRMDAADFWKRNGGVGAPFDFSQPYVLCMQHPVTTEYGENQAHMAETLEALDALGLPCILLWPNNDAGSDEVSKAMRSFREARNPEHMHFFRNLSVEDFWRVLANAKCIVGNSSAGIMESGFLGIPAVNIGTRQAGRERGPNVRDVGYDRQAIVAAMREQIQHGRYPADMYYGDGAAAPRIAQVLATARMTRQKQFVHRPLTAKNDSVELNISHRAP